MIFHYLVLLTTLHVYTQAQFPPMGFPQSMPMAMGMGMQSMPMHMPIGAPPHIPTVVMPYHSRTVDKFREKRKKPKKSRKRRKSRPKHRDSDSDSGSSSSSDSKSDSSSAEKKMRTSKDKHKRSRQVLTPVISYVTKDGYVVYQKKIKKDLAKDWLEMGKNSDTVPEAEIKDSESDEETFKKKSRKKHRTKSHVSFE